MPALFANIKHDLCGALLEFVGTFVFLSLAFGGVQSITSAGEVGEPAPHALNILIFSLTFGFSLLVSAWLFYRVTGGLFNPNVSLAFLITGIIGPVRFVLYSIAQLAGSIAASAVVLGLSPDPCHFAIKLGPGITPVKGVFIEMFVTSYLVLAILMLAVEKHHVTPFAPVGIGLTLFATQFWAIPYTGAAVNTARAFGPAVITGFPHGSHWVYWVGPCLGSVLGAFFYMILKHWDYEVINPDQAVTDSEKSPQSPVLTMQQRLGGKGRDRNLLESEKFQPGTDGVGDIEVLESHQGVSKNSMV